MNETLWCDEGYRAVLSCVADYITVHNIIDSSLMLDCLYFSTLKLKLDNSLTSNAGNIYNATALLLDQR